jgi:phospholipase D1/2
MPYNAILQEGRNCWRIRRAERVAFLIDADAYFNALYDALYKVEQDILILSWDIYGGLKLGALRGDDRTLAELLNDHLRDKPQLKVHILNWDFSKLLAMSRARLPVYKLSRQTHPRLVFHLDSQHPVGVSRHQKVVVIDNQLAFTGGLDLTRERWDTPEHHAHDPRRKRIDGTLGRPYHDVQVALQGEVADSLGDLARERWRRALGRSPAKPVKNIRIGLARQCAYRS